MDQAWCRLRQVAAAKVIESLSPVGDPSRDEHERAGSAALPSPLTSRAGATELATSDASGLRGTWVHGSCTDLLHGQAVSVRIAEPAESNVVEVIIFLTGPRSVPPDNRNRSDVDVPPDEFGSCTVDVRDYHLQSFEGAWSHVGDVPTAARR